MIIAVFSNSIVVSHLCCSCHVLLAGFRTEFNPAVAFTGFHVFALKCVVFFKVMFQPSAMHSGRHAEHCDLLKVRLHHSAVHSDPLKVMLHHSTVHSAALALQQLKCLQNFCAVNVHESLYDSSSQNA